MNEGLWFLVASPGFVGVLMANVYSFMIQDILKKNGFKTSYFTMFEDPGNFTLLINRTTDSVQKAQYKKIILRFRLSIVLMVLGILAGVFWMFFMIDDF